MLEPRIEAENGHEDFNVVGLYLNDGLNGMSAHTSAGLKCGKNRSHRSARKGAHEKDPRSIELARRWLEIREAHADADANAEVDADADADAEQDLYYELFLRDAFADPEAEAEVDTELDE